ncbi:MAG: MauE/DoxX family redox-associated membrane protein [Desulfatirhabdiaceae bacterium]
MNGIGLFKKAISHPVTGLVLRVYIGGIFIAASMYKINYPGEFAETIASYQLVPYWGVNLMALIMPWTELLCGLMLILGFRTRASAVLIAAMLVVFCVAITVTLLRGIPIGCGCFTTVEDPLSWTTLIRDLIWLAMTVQVILFPSALQLEDRLLMSLKEVDG